MLEDCQERFPEGIFVDLDQIIPLQPSLTESIDYSSLILWNDEWVKGGSALP